MTDVQVKKLKDVQECATVLNLLLNELHGEGIPVQIESSNSQTDFYNKEYGVPATLRIAFVLPTIENIETKK